MVLPSVDPLQRPERYDYLSMAAGQKTQQMSPPKQGNEAPPTPSQSTVRLLAPTKRKPHSQWTVIKDHERFWLMQGMSPLTEPHM
jgi:hypothetical protein